MFYKTLFRRLLQYCIQNKTESALWLLVLFGFGALLWILSSSFYIRPFADDITFASRENFIEHISYWYNWSGRLSSLTIYIIAGWFKLPLLWLVPWISVALLLTGCYLFFSQLLAANVATKVRNYERPLLFLMSQSIVLAVFFLTPSVYSSMFWFAAAPLHAWSYGLLMVLTAYFMKVKARSYSELTSRKRRTLEFVLILFFAMLGELATFIAIGVLFTEIINIAKGPESISRLWKRMWHVITALFIGLVVLLFSPGVENRNNALSDIPHVSVSTALSNSLAHFKSDVLSIVLGNKAIFIMLISTCFIITVASLRHRKMDFRHEISWSLYWLLAFIGVIYLNLLMPIIGYHSPDMVLERTFVPTILSLLGITIIISVWLARIVILSTAHDQRLFIGIALGFIVILTFQQAKFYYHEAKDFRQSVYQRSLIYDEREKMIHDIKVSTTTSSPSACPLVLPIAPLDITQENNDIYPDAKTWQNMSLQKYYKLSCEIVGR